MSKEYNINCDSCQEYMAIINAVTYGSASSNNKIEEKKDSIVPEFLNYLILNPEDYFSKP